MKLPKNSQTEFQNNKDWNYVPSDLAIFRAALTDRIPEQQGLKHFACYIKSGLYDNSQTEFQNNKDWNKQVRKRSQKRFDSQTEFQNNKDWNLFCCIFELY